MKQIFVACAVASLVGCAGHEVHIENQDLAGNPVMTMDYTKTGNGSTSYTAVTKFGNGMYPGAQGFVGGYAPTGQTPMMVVQMPSESEGMNAMEQHGAASAIILQQQVPINVITTSDKAAIKKQFRVLQQEIDAIKGGTTKGEPQ